MAEKNRYTKRRFQVVKMAVCKAPVDQYVGIPKGGIPNIRHSSSLHAECFAIQFDYNKMSWKS